MTIVKKVWISYNIANQEGFEGSIGSFEKGFCTKHVIMKFNLT